MKIRIVKASKQSYWYADKIGEVFEITSLWRSCDDGSTRYGIVGEDGYIETIDCEEVIEHNSQLYRKVDRPVREGDTVLIVDAYTTFGKYKNGDVLRCDGVPKNGSYMYSKQVIAIPGNDTGVIDAHEFVVLEAIEQPVQPTTFTSAPSYAEVSELLHEAKEDTKTVTLQDVFIASSNAWFESVTKKLDEKDDVIEHNGKQYRKVKRKAAVGELVIGIDQEDYIASVDGYIVGNVYMVTRLTEESDGTIKYDVDDMFSDGTPLFLYESEFNVLELVEQSGQGELLSVNDLLANLAQEVAELKRFKEKVLQRDRFVEQSLSGLKGELTNAKTDIADLEDRVDENEKDTEEVIGRMNDLGDGAEAAAVDFDKLIDELSSRRAEATADFNAQSRRGDAIATSYYDGMSIGYNRAITKIKEALRNA